MIALVDDDPHSLSFLREVLTRAGHAVVPFASAAAALEGLADDEPQLVISDVVMPGMSGLEFRRAYGSRHGDRRTPFVFLSSLGETTDVVRGLDAGADDYLMKPVAPELLLAKVRAHLRRGAQAAPRTFHGDLSRFPLAKIVEFCELQGLTGEVAIDAGQLHVRIAFRGGAVVEGDPEHGEAVARAFELPAGSFVIRAEPVDFEVIAGAAAGEPPIDPAARPAGRLSAVTVGDRLVQLQTEYVTSPSPMVVSVALREGRTLQKRTARATGTREVLERLVEEQHGALEQEVRARLAQLAASRAPTPGPLPAAAPPSPAAPPEPAPSFHELLAAGIEASLAGDNRRALEAFERAQALDPSHPALAVNVEVVRKRLGRTGG